MSFSLKVRLAPARAAGFALVSSLAIALSAHAASGHDDGHGGGHGHDEPKAASAKSRSSAPKAAERHAEGHGGAHGETRRGDKAPAGKEQASGKPDEAAGAEGRGSVSMAELRDMIDQKIAEVRSKREAAPTPVVRLRTKSRASAPASAARKPAAELHASVNPSPQPAPVATAPVNDGRGAVLPLPDEHAHIHAAPHRGGHAINPMGRDVHWAYAGDTGPEHWGRLKPEFQQCMLGKRQSPIDIRDGIPVQLDPIQFDYRSTAFRVIDNGHTVQVNVDPGNGITVQGRRYELVQFHFHRPSEERINGRQFEMVAHLVHKDPDGRLAVVAVLMDAGKGHPLVQQVWNNLPLEKQTEQAALAPMDLNLLLPEKRHYYTYMGSLTTPPCTEGVLWMVMKQPASVSREQIGVFSKLYQMNARPIQSVAGRLIKDGQ